MLNGNAAFIDPITGLWHFGLITPSSNPQDYASIIVNLDRNNIYLSPPELNVPGGSWAYYPDGCIWVQVSLDMYSQILTSGRICEIEYSKFTSLPFGLKQDTMISDKVSNNGSVGNIEVFPGRLSLQQKVVAGMQKIDGSKYTVDDESDYIALIDPKQQVWKVFPRIMIVAEPYTTLAGTVGWRPQTINNLIQQIDDNVIVTGRIAFVHHKQWKYARTSNLKMSANEFAAVLTNLNMYDPLLQSPKGTWAYHLNHGAWYEIETQSWRSIEKANMTGKITYLGNMTGLASYQNQINTEYNPEILNKYTINELRSKICIVNNESGIFDTNQLISYKGAPGILGEIITNLTNKSPSNKIIKHKNNIVIVRQGICIHGVSHIEDDLNKPEHFAYTLVGFYDILPDSDPGYHWFFHIPHQIWYQVEDSCAVDIFMYGQVHIYGSRCTQLPIQYEGLVHEPARYDSAVELFPSKMPKNQPKITTLINPKTNIKYTVQDSQHLVIIWLHSKWEVVPNNLAVSGLYRDLKGAVHLLPTTINQLWIDNGVDHTDANVKQTNRTAFMDLVSGVWRQGLQKISTTADHFASALTNYHSRDIRFQPPGIPAQEGHIWAYHIDHKIWYEVDLNSWHKIVKVGKIASITHGNVLPPTLPKHDTSIVPTKYNQQYQVFFNQGNYVISVQQLSGVNISLLSVWDYISQNAVPMDPASMVAVPEVDNKGVLMWKNTTFGLLALDYSQKNNSIEPTNRAAYLYAKKWATGINPTSTNPNDYTTISYSTAPFIHTTPGYSWACTGTIWQEVSRASYFIILKNNNFILNQNQVPLKNRTDLFIQNTMHNGNVEIFHERVFSSYNHNLNTGPLYDYFQRNYKNITSVDLVVIWNYTKVGGANWEVVRGDSLLTIQDGQSYLIMSISEAISDINLPVNFIGKAAFIDEHGRWWLGQCSPEPATPNAFVTFFRNYKGTEPPFDIPIDYYWTYHNIQGLWYALDRKSYVQVYKISRTASMKEVILPVGIPKNSIEIDINKATKLVTDLIDPHTGQKYSTCDGLEVVWDCMNRVDIVIPADTIICESNDNDKCNLTILEEVRQNHSYGHAVMSKRFMIIAATSIGIAIISIVFTVIRFIF